MDKQERKYWLEDAIEEYIRNNPNKDSVDIVSYFKLRADIILDSLDKLMKQGKVIRQHLCGINYGYVICENNFNNDDRAAVCSYCENTGRYRGGYYKCKCRKGI